MPEVLAPEITHYLSYGEHRIAYQIKYFENDKAKQKLKIHVQTDGLITVEAPAQTPRKVIKESLRRQAQWILDKQKAAQEHISNVLPREYVSGESYFYLGRRHMLKVIPVARLPDKEKAEKAKLLRGKIEVYSKTPDKKHIKRLLYRWYKQRAEVIFSEHLTRFSQMLPWLKETPKLNISPMGTQWGSCSSQGNISLNLHLIKAPTPCIEYVILHELCHLQQKNHGPDFYQLLERYQHDWSGRKQRLDELSALLFNE